MLKKVVATLLIVSSSVLCLPVFSSAAQPQVMYSDLPQPVPDENTQYFILSNGYAANTYLFCFSFPMGLSIDNEFKFMCYVADNGNWTFFCLADSFLDFQVSMTVFNALTGEFIMDYKLDCIDAGSALPYWQFQTWYNYGYFLDLGVTYINNESYPKSMLQIHWADVNDPDTYESWLDKINSKLNNIDSNTDNVETKLDAIQSEIKLFERLFGEYRVEQHSDLTAILGKIQDIYNLLNQEQTTRPPAIENESEVQNVLDSEAALNKDFSGDLNKQFNVAGDVFDGNSAFSFIRDLFQSLLLSNYSINSLIIFSLAIGLCVLILGRRLNA